MLTGYGPIDAELARELAADADWQRWVSDPVDGHLLDEGDRRFPGARLRRFVLARDPVCSHPNCAQPVHRCDVDHLTDHAKGGQTKATGLRAACPHHNRTKNASGWTTEPTGDGQATWTSPLGQTYQAPLVPVLPVLPSDPTPPPW